MCCDITDKSNNKLRFFNIRIIIVWVEPSQANALDISKV